jgi:hypothetical protein
VVHLIPVRGYQYFPSQDGPAHLENAVIVREYQDPERTAFRTFYELNDRFTPNWLGHLVLAGLMTLVPPLVAEKVFLSGYLILLPLAIRYAVLGVRRDSAFLAVLGFPFVYNYTLHMGFYSFSYSLAMFFLVIGYWLRHRESAGLRHTVTLAVLLLLLYFALADAPRARQTNARAAVLVAQAPVRLAHPDAPLRCSAHSGPFRAVHGRK